MQFIGLFVNFITESMIDFVILHLAVIVVVGIYDTF